MGNYTIYFSDPAKRSTPIVIPDGSEDTQSTSLTLIGRNYPGYGQAIATDLVYLLENFSSAVPPTNPVEGQLWFDTSDPNNKKLRINDGGATGSIWTPINGIFQQPNQPTNVKLGDIWVDTARQQLNFYNGSSFTLVGPNYSSSTKTGSYSSTLIDISNRSHNVIINYVNDNAVEIISFDAEFTPNPIVNGFSSIKPGINVSSFNVGSVSSPVSPIFNGIASTATALLGLVSGVIPADSVLRNDVSQSINGTFNITVDNNSLQIGSSPTFILDKQGLGNTRISNTYNSGQIIFRISNSSGSLTPIMVLDGGNQTVTINSPTSVSQTAGVNLYGSLLVSNSSTVNTLYVNSTLSNITDVAGNALEVAGGVGIGQTLVVYGEHILKGPLTVGLSPITAPLYTATSIVIPTKDLYYDLGDPQVRWRNVYSQIFQAGNGGTAQFVGIASSATYMSSPSAFSISGDLTSSPVNFYGGGIPVSLNASANSSLITGKATTSSSTSTDSMLMYSLSQNQLYQHSKRNFLKDINYFDTSDMSFNTGITTPSGSLVPVGTIIAFAGSSAPAGWLSCNGANIGSLLLYQNLRNVIGTTYDPAHSSYLLPNLTGPVSSGTVSVNYIIKY